jgi:DNA-binding LacI/PurR family transcriptional regulator
VFACEDDSYGAAHLHSFAAPVDNDGVEDRLSAGVAPELVYAALNARTGGIAQIESPLGMGDPNRCLGVIFSCDEVADPEHPFFGPLVDGIRARAIERNADLFVCFPKRGSQLGAGGEAIDRCRRRGVNGIVLLGQVVGDAESIASKSAAVPSVFVEYDPPGRKAGFAGLDNVEAMRTVVRHLASLGHRRIAHLGELTQTRSGKDRARGYVLEMESLGLPVLPGYLQGGDFYPISGFTGMQELLALPEPPEAVATASDMQAVGALVALAEAGLSCPEDVALTGFDDADYAATLDPPLTTVNQAPAELGAQTVDALFDMIVYPQKRPPTVLGRGELVVRDSCGARRHAAVS